MQVFNAGDKNRKCTVCSWIWYLNLKKTTDHGHDDMSTRLLKERISIIIHPIT